MEILFLAHRAPFPPDRGDRIRSYNVLRHLAARATVHLVALADDAAQAAVPAGEAARLGEVHVFARRRSLAHAALAGLARGTPASVEAFADRRMVAVVTDLLARRPIDAIYAFSGQMGQYLPAKGPRAVMDFVDLDSAKFAAYAGKHRGPIRWFYAREARLLAKFERQVATRAAASLFVSAAEARLLPGARAIENGVDTGYFKPAVAFAQLAERGPLIAFTGQMDYRPNIDAAAWFVREVLPAIRAQRPDARFAIVGRAPTAEVRALAGEGVIVTGEVPDVRGWLAAADAVVAPLRIARGVQNKVLEAMAMARPVVATPAAAEGLDHAGTIRVAENAAAMAGALLALLADRAAADELGASARRQVERRYGWAARLAPLDDLLGIAPAVERAA